jgi:hypothetical protein
VVLALAVAPLQGLGSKFAICRPGPYGTRQWLFRPFGPEKLSTSDAPGQCQRKQATNHRPQPDDDARMGIRRDICARDGERMEHYAFHNSARDDRPDHVAKFMYRHHRQPT